jgi:hypothetical protein
VWIASKVIRYCLHFFHSKLCVCACKPWEASLLPYFYAIVCSDP